VSTALVISEKVKGTFHPPTHAKTIRFISLCRKQLASGWVEKERPSKLTLLTFRVDHDVIDVLVIYHETVNDLRGKRVTPRKVKLGHKGLQNVLDYAIYAIYQGTVYWYNSRQGEHLIASIAHGVSPAIYELLFPDDREDC
jgi:hypothetical protein